MGGKSISQSATILKNDLIILKDAAIGSRQPMNAVVVFQVPKDLDADMS